MFGPEGAVLSRTFVPATAPCRSRQRKVQMPPPRKVAWFPVMALASFMVTEPPGR